MTATITVLPVRRQTAELFVAGLPAPQGSKRHVGGGVMVESSKKLKPWRKTIAEAARAHFAGYVPLDGAVHIDLEFVMPRPKATPKTKPTPPAVKRPDLDKLVRGALDALSGIAYGDDSQIISMSPEKRVAELGEATGLYLAVRPTAPRRTTRFVRPVIAA